MIEKFVSNTYKLSDFSKLV